MCGISWIDLKTKKIKHKTFIINYLNQLNQLNKINEIDEIDEIYCLDEQDLIIKLNNFIINFKPKNMKIDNYLLKTRLIHWSNAEPSLYN
jgi:hypothetical protein